MECIEEMSYETDYEVDLEIDESSFPDGMDKLKKKYGKAMLKFKSAKERGENPNDPGYDPEFHKDWQKVNNVRRGIYPNSRAAKKASDWRQKNKMVNPNRINHPRRGE